MTKEKLKKPVWLKYTKTEVKEIILKLAKKGLTAEKIGLVLRDTHGIPKAKLYDLKISKILKQGKSYKNPDLKNTTEKEEKLKKYMEKNKQDKKAKRAFLITHSKLKKIKRYQEKGEEKEEDAKSN